VSLSPPCVPNAAFASARRDRLIGMGEADAEAVAAAARRLGIEADSAEARRWMLAVSSTEESGIAADDATGIFGDRVSLLDFDRDDLERLRRLVPHVRLAARPDVESAIAIAGSSAQGRVQLFPGDADFFERVHVHAASADEAARVVRAAMWATAVRAFAEPDVVLLEANLGVYPEAVIERGQRRAVGDPIIWSPADVSQRRIDVETPAGGTCTVEWDDTEIGRGWVYLGWIVADRDAGRIALASNMIDATWEDPDGTIFSLDGAVDPLAQEVYLEPAALPLVARLATEVERGAGDAYRSAMRSEAYHYTHVEPNFAKAAKRLYNLFRVSDELEAAVFVGELFDEPSAGLYQVPGLLEAADAALDPAAGIDRDLVLGQLDVVAETVAAITEGGDEAELLSEIRRLRSEAAGAGRDAAAWTPALAEVRARCATIVNDFFRAKLLADTRVRVLIGSLADQPDR
jgi:hypothetical protein